MKITSIKLYEATFGGNCKAYGSVTFDGELVIKDIKVMSSEKGYFVSMPSRKNKDENYQDIAFPVTKEFRAYLNDEILKTFQADFGNVITAERNADDDTDLPF